VEKLFREVGDGSVRFIATREEVLSFINQIREQDKKDLIAEIEKMEIQTFGKDTQQIWDKMDIIASEVVGYNRAISEVKELLNKYV